MPTITERVGIPQDAFVDDSQHEEVKKTILKRLTDGETYWRPLHARQDHWAMMYYLMDVIQQMKPVGYRRFISNEPRTAVDLAISILTRNDAFWRIALFEEMAENSEDRRLIGKIERTLQGIVYDIDEMFSMRLRMRFWKQAAASALIRGFIWGKVHVTTEALKYRDTPIIAEIYDPRLVYPHVDAFGLNYVIIKTVTTLGELVNMYPESFGDREMAADYDPNRPAIKIEYWSNDRGEKKGINAVMATEIVDTGIITLNTNTDVVGSPTYVIKPYYHGYTPDALPVIGVPVNGLDLVAKPALSHLVTERMQQRHEVLGQTTSYAWWAGQNSHVAEMGRSILASVEEHVPQYNEMIATIMQHLALATYGTWIFTSPTGELPRFSPGIESQIPLTPDERLERVQIGPINSDAFKLVDLLNGEKQNGMLSNILRANEPTADTGVLFQQMANSALNALEPFQDGMEEFGQRVGTSILAQMKAAAPILKPFSVLSPGQPGASKRQAYWMVEFDPKNDLKGKRKFRPRPVFKPSLPDDIAVRINAARLALDPRRPILSLTYVLENILQIEDPTSEIDRIWEDIANTDPVIVLEQTALALERMGENELAERIRDKQFQTAFTEELAFKQATGGAISQPGAPPNMPPEAGAGQFNTQTQEGMGGGPSPGAEGGGAVGAMGERASV